MHRHMGASMSSSGVHGAAAPRLQRVRAQSARTEPCLGPQVSRPVTPDGQRLSPEFAKESSGAHLHREALLSSLRCQAGHELTTDPVFSRIGDTEFSSAARAVVDAPTLRCRALLMSTLETSCLAGA
jgi:hypothetical protein